MKTKASATTLLMIAMTEKNRKLNVLVSGNILQNQLQKCQMVFPTLPDDVDLDEVDKDLPAKRSHGHYFWNHLKCPGFLDNWSNHFR